MSFLWYRVRKFELVYFLDGNREFQPLSIHVTASCLVKLADMKLMHPIAVETQKTREKNQTEKVTDRDDKLSESKGQYISKPKLKY
jgi:hypothetical protein